MVVNNKLRCIAMLFVFVVVLWKFSQEGVEGVTSSVWKFEAICLIFPEIWGDVPQFSICTYGLGSIDTSFILTYVRSVLVLILRVLYPSRE